MKTVLTPNQMIAHLHSRYTSLCATSILLIISIADDFNEGRCELDDCVSIGEFDNIAVGDLFADFGIEIEEKQFPLWVETLTNNIIKTVENEYRN